MLTWARLESESCRREGPQEEAMNRNTITIRAILSASVCVALFSTGLQAQDRLPPIPAAKLTETQKKAVADFRAARNTDPTGPFSVMLRVPELMDLAFKWRQHVQARCVLEQRLAELVILVTARHWTQQYEWNAQQPLAITAGL